MDMMMFHSPAIVFPIRKKRTIDKYGKPLYAQVSTYGKQLLEKQYGNGDDAQTRTYMELLGVTDEVLYDEPPPTIPTFDGISPKDRALATAPINRYVCGPFIHSGRHPAYEYGYDEQNEEWRCCGLPYSSSGCWSSEKRVLYNFAPAIRIAKKPLNRENWLVPPRVGTKWYDFAYYDRLDAEMRKIKELITSFDWNDELTLRNLVRLYTLERYYNEVQEFRIDYPIDRDGWIAFIQNDLMIQGPDLPLNPPFKFEEPEAPEGPPGEAGGEGDGGNGDGALEEEELPELEDIVSVFDEKMIDLLVRAESIVFTNANNLVSYIRNAHTLEELESAETRLIVLETNQNLWNDNANDPFRSYLAAHPTINGQDYLEFLESNPPLDIDYSTNWRNGLPWPDSIKKELESEILKLREEIKSATLDSAADRKFSALIIDATNVETIRKMLHLYVENHEQVNGTFLDAAERRYIQNHMYVDNKPYLVISEKKKAVLADLASLGKQGAEFYKTIQNVKPSKYANNPAKFDVDITEIIKAGFNAERDANPYQTDEIRQLEYVDSTSWNKLHSIAFQQEMERLKLEEEREQLALTQKRLTKELRTTLKEELINLKQIITKQDYELFKDLISNMDYSKRAEAEFSLALHFAYEKLKLLRILDMFPEKELIADKYAQYESLWYYDDNNDTFDFERETMLLLDLFKTTLINLISSHRKIPINMNELEERMKNAPTFAALLDIYSHYLEALRNAPPPPPPRAILKVRIDKDGVSDPALEPFYATYKDVIARLEWTYDGIFDMNAIEANLVKRLKEFILTELESDPNFVTSESFGIALNNASTVKAVLELEAEKRESMIRSNLSSIETDADYRLSDYEYDWEKIHSQLIQPLSAMRASHPEAEKLGLSPYRRVEPLLLTLDDQTQYLHDLSRMEASIDYSQEQVRGISII